MLILLGSCSKGPDFARSFGPEKTTSRTLDSFSSIWVSQKFDLYLTANKNKPRSIDITYGAHVIDKISSAINNGELRLKDLNHFNWVRNLNVRPKCTINLHQVTKLQIEGSCNVICLDTLQSNNLEIIMNGVGTHKMLLNCGQVFGSCTNSGNITMIGKGGVLAWTCENGSWIDASALKSFDAYIYHYTDRDIYVNPSIIFSANIYAKGNVYYYTEPWLRFEKKENGIGRVIKKQ
ncbi:MAG: DUF2807 domain-containing protein [Bacteroidia bacterium]|nr:DUF2807 domain-containing protein [Bacteroidia bacterium]